MATTIPHKFNIVRFQRPELIPDIEKFLPVSIFKMAVILKMAAKIRHEKWTVKIQHCPLSSKFDMWVDYDVPNLFSTLKNF
jgi:hypothetical protein